MSANPYDLVCNCEACQKAKMELLWDSVVNGQAWAKLDNDGHVHRVDPKDVYIEALAK